MSQMAPDFTILHADKIVKLSWEEIVGRTQLTLFIIDAHMTCQLNMVHD